MSVFAYKVAKNDNVSNSIILRCEIFGLKICWCKILDICWMFNTLHLCPAMCLKRGLKKGHTVHISNTHAAWVADFRHAFWNINILGNYYSSNLTEDMDIMFHWWVFLWKVNIYSVHFKLRFSCSGDHKVSSKDFKTLFFPFRVGVN